MRAFGNWLGGLGGCLLAAAVAATVAVATPTAGGTTAARTAKASSCPQPRISPSYARRVARALRSRSDVWGKALLASPQGPTFERAQRYLTPVVLARAPQGRPLTSSGVHYAHFTLPNGPWGATTAGLHVADGSEIAFKRIDGRRVRLGVGIGGRERFGSCLRRLRPAALAEGYLPVLQTRYTDRVGVRYEQESFVGRVSEVGALVSFVRLRADAGGARAAVRLRFTPSARRLSSDGLRLLRRGRTHAYYSPGGRFTGSAVTYSVARGESVTVYLAWPHTPVRSRSLLLDATLYDEARAAVVAYWERRLARGASIVVPEQRVVDAQRNLLVQNMGLTWRYSIGNRYEQFSTPEGVDVGRVLAAYGHPEVTRAILHTSIRRRAARHRKTPIRNPNWKMGSRLVGFADQARLSGDLSHVVRATPVLRGYVLEFARQLRSSRNGLLRRERYSSDVPDWVYGLHAQSVVWQGLRSLAPVWERTGNRDLARLCRRLAARLGTGLRRAVRAGQRRLRDGTLFVPVRLYEHERPYGSLSATRSGSYWNLVMPYALASGLFRPGSGQAKGVFAYMQRHGARLLGLPRTGAYPLYGASAFPKSGSNPVYGLNVARFLADNDEPGQLVLSLYGHLAAAMTPGTFISGEGVSIAPLRGERLRSMYLPPNGASNAAFLETLRLMLVHETTDRRGAPRGLELGFATPRTWLAPGKRIEVRRLATSFGRVSYTIASLPGSVHVELEVPARNRLRALKLRLRLPQGRIASVALGGQRYSRFDPRTETIALPPRPGRMELQVVVTGG